MKLLLLIVTVLSALHFCTLTSALSTGAAGCEDGQAAVGDLHLQNENGVGQFDSFASRNLQFSINDMVMEPTATEISDSRTKFLLQPSGLYEMKLTALQQKQPFKGALIRVQHDVTGTTKNETTTSFQVNSLSPNAQVAEACATLSSNVVGITHKDNTPKFELSGTLMFAILSNGINHEGNSTITIDVTVVDYNNATGSLFGHEQYTLGIADVVTETPTVSPAPSVPAKVETLEPTVTNAPTSSISPTFVTKCNLCGYSNFEVDASANVILGNTLVSCTELAEAGIKGFVDPEFCAFVQEQATENCGCLEMTSAATDAPSVPVVTIDAPTFSPTLLGVANSSIAPTASATTVPTATFISPNIDNATITMPAASKNTTMIPAPATMQTAAPVASPNGNTSGFVVRQRSVTGVFVLAASLAISCFA